MITPDIWRFGESMRAIEETSEEWKVRFLSKGRNYTEGFLAGFKEARSPFGRWFRERVMHEMDARKLGAENALKEFSK